MARAVRAGPDVGAASVIRVRRPALPCVLALLGSLSSVVAHAQCPPSAPRVAVDTPEVAVEVQDVRSVIDYTVLPWQTQNRMAPGWVMNGLTVAHTIGQFRIETLQGPGCFRISQVRALLSYQDPVKVYIADKYDPGSCPHETIRTHEMQHVDIFRRGRLIYAERLRQKLAAATPAAEAAGTDAGAQAALKSVLDDVMREFGGALGAAHGAIDTAENYNAIKALCPRW
jgi:hypothetical protein